MMTLKNIISAVFAIVLISGCAKKNNSEDTPPPPRPEFGGRTAEEFYSLFQAKPSGCDKGAVYISHQRFQMDADSNVEIDDNKFLWVSIYFVNNRFRLNFDAKTFWLGSPSSVVQGSKPDHESVIGEWSIQDKSLVLVANGAVIAVMQDGLPHDGEETMSAQFRPILQKQVPLNLAPLMNRKLLLHSALGVQLDPQDHAAACRDKNVGSLIFR
ncbi:MAG: hypothetical protein ACXWQE_07565 [Bdellovibrionales bacterium]